MEHCFIITDFFYFYGFFLPWKEYSRIREKHLKKRFLEVAITFDAILKDSQIPKKLQTDAGKELFVSSARLQKSC